MNSGSLSPLNSLSIFSVRRSVCRLLVVLLLLTGLEQSALAQDVRLENNPVLITGPLQVRFAFTDKNGAPQDLPVQQVPFLNGLPWSLQQTATSLLLTGNASSYFDQLWNGARGNVCGEIFNEITTAINSSDNSAYNVNCTSNPRGVLSATIEKSWRDDYGFGITGRRFTLDYWIPDNSATFSVTSPCTCRQSNEVCAADPQFTLVFDVHLIAKFVRNDPASIVLPFTDAHAGSVVADAVVAGDYSDAVATAVRQFDEQVAAGAVAAAAGGELITLGDLAVSTVQLLAQLGGIAVAGACNSHLRDTVSAQLGPLYSGTAGSGAVSVSQQFGGLFQNLLAGFSAGFSQFDIVSNADHDLIFRWTAPPAAKPTLFNLDAKENVTPSLFPPTIGSDQTQVTPGGKLTIHGRDFQTVPTTHLRVGWNDTVPGQQTSAAVDWQRQGGPIQHATTSQSFFEADNLSPGTSYQFRVRICTVITCSPESDWLSLTTQGQGSDQVALSLDDVANSIGSTTLGAEGSFTTSVTIPRSTAAGPHVM